MVIGPYNRLCFSATSFSLLQLLKTYLFYALCNFPSSRLCGHAQLSQAVFSTLVNLSTIPLLALLLADVFLYFVSAMLNKLVRNGFYLAHIKWLGNKTCLVLPGKLTV
jgi:hypothetical protein